MPWRTARPGGSKTDAKYRSREHRAQRKALEAQLARDGYLTCGQPICKMPDRTILPGMRWCAGHDDTGTAYVGAVHWRCNVVDGSVRARQRQQASRLRW